MTYFNNVNSYEDLKAQYRALALANHPDMGGSDEAMKAINNEYDQLFPVWKHRSNITASETAQSTRSEFYTQYGWKGENYNSKLSLKEIACIIREFIKIHYNNCKFSVTTEYASMCQELHISLMESPYKAYKEFSELTEEEKTKLRHVYCRHNNINSYMVDELNAEIEKVFDKEYACSYLTDDVKEIVSAVAEYANSFNYDDSDAQIDYFSNNFYFFGVKVGKWDKPYKQVVRIKKNMPDVEYETVTVTKTRTKKVLEPKEITTPVELKQGQLIQLKSNFNYGCYRGAVYQIDRVSDGGIIYAYKMGKGYKNVCKGDVRGNRFNATLKQVSTWIEKSAIVFVELVEVTKTEEYTSSIRRPKKQTGVSTEVKQDSNTDNNSTDSTTYSTENKEYTITADTDTRDNSPLWVVKFVERMSREDYKETAARLKEIGGYYSKFKKGFIFRENPENTLAGIYGSNAQNNEPPESSEIEEVQRQAEREAEQTADIIVDASTGIIIDLHLKAGEYVFNTKYKQRLSEYLNEIKPRITSHVVDKISIPELQSLVRIILENEQAGAA